MHPCAHSARSKHKGSTAEPKEYGQLHSPQHNSSKSTVVQSKHTVTLTQSTEDTVVLLLLLLGQEKINSSRNIPTCPSLNTWGCATVTKKLEPWSSFRCWEVSRAADNFIRKSYSSRTFGAEISCGNWNCQMWESIARSREPSFKKKKRHADAGDLQ